jgi:hypothetical protein
MWATLKERMGLPEGHVHAPERQLPAAPVKTLQVGGKGLEWVGGWDGMDRVGGMECVRLAWG